jgi:hypothetical protein
MSSWIHGISRLRPWPANSFHNGGSLAASRRYCRLAPLALALAMAGCGASNSSTSAPAGLQPPAPAGAYNAYVGTSPFDSLAAGTSPIGESYNGNGLWSVSFNYTPSLCPSASAPQPLGCFNATDVTTNGNNTYSGFTTVAGTFQGDAGFLNLTQTNTASPSFPQAGFAFEVPGRVAVLRQGDNTMPVSALVPSGCPSINGNTQFNFVALPTATWASATDPAYGSLLISTSGATWNFTSFQQSTLTGTAVPLPSGVAALPAGTCAPTAAGSAVYVPWDQSSFLSPLPKTIAVGPTGFYIADQGMNVGISFGFPGEFGVIQPSAALNTSDLLSHNYLGFLFEPGADNFAALPFPVPESQLGAFGGTTAAGMAALCTSTTQTNCFIGGGFPVNPNTLIDDPTQPDAMNLVIDLGAEDTTNHGFYPNVSITNELSGSVYPAVAVAGNPESKYGIFIIGEDIDNSLPLGIYLFQQ